MTYKGGWPNVPSKYTNPKVTVQDVAFMLTMALNGYGCAEIARQSQGKYSYTCVVYHIRKYRKSAVEYDMEKVRALLKSAGVELEDVLGAVKR
jgi:hypothetical protein